MARSPFAAPPFPGRLLLRLGLMALPFAAGRASGQDDLPRRLAALSEALERRRVAQNVAGMGLAVVRGGEVVLCRGFGHRDLQAGAPATEDTLFCIGSTTKAFSAMLAAMLASDGVLGLDDPVSKHLPTFHLRDPQADALVTLVDLFAHRTGLTRMSLAWYGNDADASEILACVPRAEAWAPFRTRFLYNNVMYLAAGEACARAAGRDYEALLHDRILGPLSMADSALVGDAVAADPRLSKGYGWDTERQRHVELPLRRIRNIAPAGAIVSDASDMAQWLRFLLAGGVVGGRRLVAETHFARLFQQENDAGLGGYGLGWFLRSWRGRRLVEHGGNIDGFSAEVALLPDEGVGFALLTSANATPLQSQCIDIAFEALLGDTAALEEPSAGVAPPAEDLPRYAGDYQSGPLLMTVSIDAGRLRVQVSGQPALFLRWPDAEARWRLEVDPEIFVRFTAPDGAPAQSLTLFQGGVERQLARRTIVLAPPPMSAAELGALRAEKLGTAAAAGLEAVLWKGEARVPTAGLTGRYTVLAAGDGRLFEEIDFGPFGRFRGGYDGWTAWQESTAFGRRELTGELREHLTWRNPLALAGDWQELAREIEATGGERAGDRPAVRVRFTGFEGGSMQVLASLEDGRVLSVSGRISVLDRLGSDGFEFDDYRDVGGVLVPFLLTTRSEPLGRIELRCSEAAVLADVDPDCFKMPGD